MICLINLNRRSPYTKIDRIALIKYSNTLFRYLKSIFNIKVGLLKLPLKPGELK
jgi:hypothetical protein